MNFIRTQRVGDNLSVEMHVEGCGAMRIFYNIEQLGALISMLCDQERDLLKVLVEKHQSQLPPFLTGR